MAVALLVRGDGATTQADVLEVLRMQLEPQASAERLYEFQARHGGAPLIIEATRDGKAIAKALRSIDERLLLREVAPIGDKFTRAQPVASAWNQGRVRLPMHAPWLVPLLDEFDRFTGMGDRHDDQVDALSQGWNAAASMPGAYESSRIRSSRR